MKEILQYIFICKLTQPQVDKKAYTKTGKNFFKKNFEKGLTNPINCDKINTVVRDMTKTNLINGEVSKWS